MRILCIVVLLSGQRAAAAEPTADLQRAKESFQAGATAYAAGDYQAAIQALAAAYAITPLPAIAFSLAQAERRQYFVDHEREHLQRAVTLYRRYVGQVPAGGRRADALDALSQLEPLAAAESLQNARPATSERGANRHTRLMITSDAPDSRLSLDGGSASHSPLIREVVPGKHRVAASADGFFPESQEVVAIEGELIPATMTLRERPSTLVIWTARGAEIYVDGAFASEGGSGISLQLSSGTHHLAVAKKGHRPWYRTLVLERGGRQTIQVTLETTPQRGAAHGMLIGGGAALGTGYVLGALAIRAENRAKDFLDRQARGNVTGPELSRYDENITDRNRYRIAATISLASAAALFVTGAFLHELDKPNAQELVRAGRPAEPLPRSAHTLRSESMRFTPMLSADAVGLGFQALF